MLSEEADTVMILHLIDLGVSVKTVHIMTQATDVLVLVLRRLPIFCTHFSLVKVDAKCCLNQSMTNLELQKPLFCLVL